MKLEVSVSEVELGDVVKVLYNEYDEQTGVVTLGDVIMQRLLEQLTADPRWGDLAQRFAEAANWWMDHAAPGYVEQLVAAEVTRQLESAAQGAVTRGKPSTRAEAVVATEVTTQMREQFRPVVEQALGALRKRLNDLADQEVREFVERLRGGDGG